MLAADPLPPAPRFRLWVRRQAVAEGPFSVRFEVFDGKGILRVARPGVLIDPPARPIGFEERLTVGQLRSSRFLLVWDGGRARQGYLLGRIDEGTMDRLELDRWVELETFVEGGFRYLTLGAAFALPPVARNDAVRRPSLSELRQALDSMTVSDEELVDDPDSALDALTGVPGSGKAPPTPLPPVLDPPTARIAGKAVQPNADAIATLVPGTPSPVEAPGPVAPPAWNPAIDAPIVKSPPPTVAAPDTHVVRLGEAPRPVLPAVAEAPPAAPPTPFRSLDVPESEPDSLASSPTMFPGGSDDEEEMLEAGEASDEELLEAGEAPEDEEGEMDGAAARASVYGAVEGDAFGFDDDEMAAFAVDTPATRRSTEHIMRGGGVEEAVTFFPGAAREEMPPLRTIAPARVAEPEPETLAEEPEPFHRNTGTLVRHLRRQLGDANARVATLAARVAELEAQLARERAEG